MTNKEKETKKEKKEKNEKKSKKLSEKFDIDVSSDEKAKQEEE